MERYFNWSFSWTNWTLGVWFYRVNKYCSHWGIDLGPLELTWKHDNVDLRKRDKEIYREAQRQKWERLGNMNPREWEERDI